MLKVSEIPLHGYVLCFFTILARYFYLIRISEDCADDGFNITARSLHSWITRVLYNKRCKFDPLWTTFLVAGTDVNDNGDKSE